jgi:hypothetical protein
MAFTEVTPLIGGRRAENGPRRRTGPQVSERVKEMIIMCVSLVSLVLTMCQTPSLFCVLIYITSACLATETSLCVLIKRI